MKIIVAVVAITSLAACSHAPVSPSVSGFSGDWYSGHAINSTDYRLDDCSYRNDRTFTCRVIDRGCTNGFCEAESFTFSGTWALAGTHLTRRTTAGFLRADTKQWVIEQQTSGELILSGGERWFRSEKARTRHVSGLEAHEVHDRLLLTH